jgi:LysM repeat protein
MNLYHIPASITLAQGIIESNSGLSPLATEANNHFGIKCHKDWEGDRFFYDDDEKQECFRKYSNVEESYRDHSLFLVNRQRYAALFSLDRDDYTGWAMGLKQAGYATNPDYPNMLIRMIESNQLYIYDDSAWYAETLALIGKKEEVKNSEELNNLPVISGKFRKNYKMPKPSDYEVIRIIPSGRKVYENNGIPLVFARKGDTWYGIAKEFGIYTYQVYKDNDLEEQDIISIGQMIYLEPKKRRSGKERHVVRAEDTMYSISQLYGVKLKLLYKYNDLSPGEEPFTGAEISLRKKK